METQTTPKSQIIVENDRMKLFIDEEVKNTLTEKLNNILENSQALNYKEWKSLLDEDLKYYDFVYDRMTSPTEEVIDNTTEYFGVLVELLTDKPFVMSVDMYNFLIEDVIINPAIYSESEEWNLWKKYYTPLFQDRVRAMMMDGEADLIAESIKSEEREELEEFIQRKKPEYKKFKKLQNLKTKFLESFPQKQEPIKELNLMYKPEKPLTKEQRKEKFYNRYKVNLGDEARDEMLENIFNVPANKLVVNFEEIPYTHQQDALNRLADFWNNKIMNIPITEKYMLLIRCGKAWRQYPLHSNETRKQIESLFTQRTLTKEWNKKADDKLEESNIYKEGEIPEIKFIDEIRLINLKNMTPEEAENVLLTKKKNRQQKYKASKQMKQRLRDADIERAKDPNVPDSELYEPGLTYRKQIKALEEKHKKVAKRNYADRSGSFWPYTIKPHVPEEIKNMLVTYQIFESLESVDRKGRKIQRAELYDNCFVYALKMAGISEPLLNQIRARNYSRTVGKKQIDILLEEIGIAAEIYFVENNGKIDKSKNKQNKGTTRLFGKKDAKIIIKLGCLEGHYFLLNKVPITKFYFEHSDDIIKYCKQNNKPLEWGLRVSRLTNAGLYRIDSNKDSMSSFDLLRFCLSHDYFEPLTWGKFGVMNTDVYRYIPLEMSDLKNINFKRCARPMKPKNKVVDDMDYNEEEYHEVDEDGNFIEVIPDNIDAEEAIKLTEEEIKEKEHLVFYADFETRTMSDEHELLAEHKPFLICASMRGNNFVTSFYGHNCDVDFMEYLPDNATVYFHNLGYDGNFLAKFGIQSVGTIRKGNKMYRLVVKYLSRNGETKKIYFRDSLALISAPLSRFPVMFKLEGEKEVFPYNYYTKHIIDNPTSALISECHKYEAKKWNDETMEQFKKNIIKADAYIDEEHFDAKKYSEFYCRRDVEILRDGFEIFRNGCLSDFDLDVDKFLTASSLANAYFTKEIYHQNENLYEYSGLLREYIKKAVLGGRCMCAENKSYHVTKKLTDYDAVSLYPSAMARLWLCEGIPAYFTPEMFDPGYLFMHSFDSEQTEPTEEKFISGYVCEIEILKIGINRKFPLIVKREGGLNLNVNECVKMTVDNITLEDLFNFHDVEVKILSGIFWSGKRDHKIREVVTYAFNKRNELKKLGNPLQENYKLILNSAYGKTIQRAIDTNTVYKNSDDYLAFVIKNYQKVKTVYNINGCDRVGIEVTKQIDTYFNNALFGVQVLSMSKRIMSEVMTLAEDLNLNIYYQDTDSMHIEVDHLPILEKEFFNTYGRELRGSNMGQFHPDFEPCVRGGKIPVSVESYFIGKKSYVDKLMDEDGNISYHIRLKGIPGETIKVAINEDIKIKEVGVMGLYKKLFDDETVNFDLCKNRVQFKQDKGLSIKSMREFKRKVKRPEYEKIEN